MFLLRAASPCLRGLSFFVAPGLFDQVLVISFIDRNLISVGSVFLTLGCNILFIYLNDLICCCQGVLNLPQLDSRPF